MHRCLPQYAPAVALGIGAGLDFIAGTVKRAPAIMRRTGFEWLSRDEAEVDRYIDDPFCGIQFTKESAASFAALREHKLTPAALAGVRAGLPIFVFVGDEDPINQKLERLTPLVDTYRAAGLDVTLKVYPGGRHEMLNETNRDEVVAELLAWLDGTVAKL